MPLLSFDAPWSVSAPRALSRPSDVAGAVVPAEAKRWFALAVGSLVIAGLLSLAVVLGRLPVLSRLIDDPLFFKRCLVVHVDLALVVWFYAFLCGLARLRSASTGAVGVLAFTLSVAGLGAMLAGALVRGAQPILANYVPVIDHPLFQAGLAAFFLGAVVFLLTSLFSSAGRRPAGMPADTAVGLQAAAIAFVLAATTWICTRATLPEGLEPWTRFEFSAWGAGHVLQVANAAAMLAVWLWLLARATGKAVFREGTARLLFTALIAPHFALPLLTARGALDPLYHHGATLLMRWGVFPVVLIVLAAGVRHLRRCHLANSGSVAPNSGGGLAVRPAEAGGTGSAADPLAPAARAGFFASGALTVLGIALGMCIRSSTTLVPAHYHASLGGVTVAFMTAAYLVLAVPMARATAPVSTVARLAISGRRQLMFFGVGQSVFALGFAIGGAYGLGRKTYAAEQHVRSAGEFIGLGVMGVGGLAAAAAGLWFLFLVLREMRAWVRPAAAAPLSYPPS